MKQDIFKPLIVQINNQWCSNTVKNYKHQVGYVFTVSRCFDLNKSWAIDVRGIKVWKQNVKISSPAIVINAFLDHLSYLSECFYTTFFTDCQIL